MLIEVTDNTGNVERIEFNAVQCVQNVGKKTDGVATQTVTCKKSFVSLDAHSMLCRIVKSTIFVAARTTGKFETIKKSGFVVAGDILIDGKLAIEALKLAKIESFVSEKLDFGIRMVEHNLSLYGADTIPAMVDAVCKGCPEAIPAMTLALNDYFTPTDEVDETTDVTE